MPGSEDCGREGEGRTCQWVWKISLGVCATKVPGVCLEGENYVTDLWNMSADGDG